MKRQIIRLTKYLLIPSIVLLTSACSGKGVCQPDNSNELSLSITAPNQYPAGIPVTAYLTIQNTSNVNAQNLYFSIPNATNYTGTTITVVNDSTQKCANIPAQSSCSFPVEITNTPTSHPGSFTVNATTNVGSAQNQTDSKLKTNLALRANTLSLTTNIGLSDVPANSQTGANGLSFLYSHIIASNTNGSTQLEIVAVVNSASAGLFNTINLTDSHGNLLNFKPISGNSGDGLTNLVQGSVVTFILTIPANTTNYEFYAQTMANGQIVNQGTTVNPISLTNSSQGVLVVQPSNFNLSTSESYTTQTITYSNTGNGIINNLAIQLAAPLSMIQNNCITTLNPGSSCTITVHSNAAAGTSGSGSIIATYKEGSPVISQYNYSGDNPISGINLSAVNNFNFVANNLNSSDATQVTLTNSGNVSESNFIFNISQHSEYFAITNGISGTPCTVINGNTVTNSLLPNSSCTVTLTYSNAPLTPQNITYLTITYNYNGSQSASSPQISMSYETIQATANLNITPTSPFTFNNIIANGISNTTQVFTVTNNGPDDINGLINDSLTSTTTNFNILTSIDQNDCQNKNNLASGQSCTYTIKFGPTTTAISLANANLNLTASSVTGGSVNATESLIGTATTPLAANIQINSVTATGSVDGDGKSSNTSFQMESTTATSATITLTYTNVGQGAAISFNIDPTQVPSGYVITQNTCNGLTLESGSANNCNVTLSPSSSATGALDIALSSSVLSGNWIDERGVQTNQAVQWNTGASSQSDIYVNIFPAAMVNATISSSSIGTPSIIRTLVNSNFYIVFSLHGGHNVNTTYNLIAPNGFTAVTSNSCTVTSNSPSCAVEFQAPAGVTTSSLFSVTTSSGGVVPTPSSLLLDVIVYSYIVNVSGNSYTQCAVNANGIDTTGCTTITPSGSGSLSAPSAITINANYAYITNYSSASYTECPISNQVIDSTACNTITPSGNGALYHPLGITINGNYVYITDGDRQKYTQCSVSNGQINTASCVSVHPASGQSFAGIVIANNYVLMTNYYYYANHGDYTQCTINGSGIDPTSCVTTSLYAPGALSNPLGITIYNNLVYIVNQNNNSYTQCSLNSSGIITSSCITHTPSGVAALNSPNGITISNNYAYIVNSNNSYTQCSVNLANGDLENCNTTAVTQFNNPYGSAIYPPQ